jgi:hypothetical protein
VRGIRLEHPELRVGCIRVGATAGTDFGRDFAPEIAADLVPRWIAHGKIPAQLMVVEEVGRSIADILAVAAVNPSVDLHDLVLRPVGGPLVGDGAGLMTMIDETREAVHGDA